MDSQELQLTCKELEAPVLQPPYQSLAQLPIGNDIRVLVRQIIFLAAESAMYKTPSQLGREIYVAILDQSFEEVAKEVIS